MTKNYYLLLVLFSTIFSSTAQECNNLPTIWDQTFSSNNFNELTYGVKVNITEAARVTHFQAHDQVPLENIASMALYTNENGKPKTRIVIVENLPVSTAFETHQYPLTTPVTIQPGTYWVVYQFRSRNLECRMSFKWNDIPGMVTFEVFNNETDMLLQEFPYIDTPSSNVQLSLGLTLDCNLSNQDFEINKVAIYPNPATDFIQIKGLIEETNYTIYNTLGSIIKHGKINSDQQIKTQEFASGVYIINLNNQTNVNFVKK